MKIVFFGTPNFAANTLQFLLDHAIPIKAVVTKPDKARGRSKILQPTPVKVVANEHYLPIHQPEKASDPEFARILERYQADLFVVVAYGEIISQQLIDMPKLGCINVHASLLPKYRGAAPIHHALLNGEKETGVSIMHMVRKMDAGAVIKTASVSIPDHMNVGELEEILCSLGSQALLDVIYAFDEGLVTETPQDEASVTYASKVEAEDGKIQWEKPAKSIHNLIRGLTPHPGAWTMAEIRGQIKRIKLLQTRVLESVTLKPKEVSQSPLNPLIVGTERGSLSILKLQPEGKSVMTAQDFLKGVPLEALKFQ
ncbi:MAG: methionyl-tRNA formyltransferase [Chlamydiales bacterium]